jgi:hypothetical protein
LTILSVIWQTTIETLIIEPLDNTSRVVQTNTRRLFSITTGSSRSALINTSIFRVSELTTTEFNEHRFVQIAVRVVALSVAVSLGFEELLAVEHQVSNAGAVEQIRLARIDAWTH